MGAASAVKSPVEVLDGVWLINLPLPFPVGSINVYLLRAEDGFLLLDCGLKTRACREALTGALAGLGVAWTAIHDLVITHLHPDHFGLAAELRRLCSCRTLMHAAEAGRMSPAYMDNDFFARHTTWLARHGVPVDESEEIAQTSRGVQEFIEMFEVDRLLADGDRLPIAGGELVTLWTPGHSPGLLTFYEPRRRVYFSSDHLIEKITPNIGLHTHSSENPLGEYLASLDRLKPLQIDLVLPSHGHPFRGHREWIRATEQHHLERCERMLAAVSGEPRTAFQVVNAEWGTHLSPLNERFAVAEALAHLEYMRREGRVEMIEEGDIVRWRKASP